MERLQHHADWPALRSAITPDPVVEETVTGILAQMTVEEKLGQMIQPDLVELTVEDVEAYKIGSALNGAGRWPGNDRRAGAREWTDALDGFWAAAERAYRDRPFRIPFMWATDAVHGHNNVYGATVFPHNIGLGAARDPDLLHRIGVATAREIVATGMDWTFAPTVTTPRDRRWGRTYEGYSEDPEIVDPYARAMVRGLQGDAGELRTDTRVIACAKHWVADGGTFEGEDRGIARCDEDILRNVHAAGFLAAIEAGAQSVMASYSGWIGSGRVEERVHGSEYLLNVLKDKLGFDGIVVGDWDAHPYVAGCTQGDANNVIKAGVDILMISTREKWQSVHRTALAAIRSGDIPMARVDDAVRRILRVKMRAGLWDKARPRDRTLAGDQSVLGSPEHRELAREAVRKSLVLLKNDVGALPIARTARVLVTGSAADAVAKQTGGYTVTWQGDDIGTEDFPGSSTVASAVRAVAGDCTVDPYLEHTDPAGFDVAIVAIGEDAYAEMMGTIKPWRTIEYGRLKPAYARDRETLRRLRAADVTTVTVMFSGRPLYVTPELNLSDAFVAAWLPGPDVTGLTDVLFTAPDGTVAHDFQGRLSVSWPRGRRSFAANRVPRHIPDYQPPAGEIIQKPLFAYDHGLTLRDPAPDLGDLPLDDEPDAPVAEPAGDAWFAIGPRPDGAYTFKVSATDYGPRPLPLDQVMKTSYILSEPIDEGLALTFTGARTFVYAQSPDGEHRDLRAQLRDGGVLSFAVRVHQAPDGPFWLTCHDDFPQQPTVDITGRLAALPPGVWSRLEIPLTELAAAGIELDHVDVPFMLHTEARARLDVSDVRITAKREG
ncbi:1,4-beta-D-glucan glucohydrolase [Actinoplanes ianthinogenes]|uniref:1,4-beta-D-glucan glucohydrolase n=1 Tax=Actinoplanes ianthinogenes TaxID=122358 RepID=A0ABM7M351_9ACTN|nr:glycoside hydrolase family 3 protein [Actinoplanes ianthinogenes]BCJ45985.1 1,4-beta-D-glucan glucohydrolase [Actinoplanes ianthinogenes]GGR25518.1 1,4-beta-D-glucan glucohydrolase [Actinoplanes ianthinogenes]